MNAPKTSADHGEGREFKRIARFFSPLTQAEETDSLGNDAALLSVPAGMELVVSMDTLVESVHFLTEDAEQAEKLAMKSLGVNLSDLAAMGAKPWRYTLSLATTPRQNDDWFESFARGLWQQGQAAGCVLAGGDCVGTDSGLVVTVTALGLVPTGRAFHRKNARPGDVLWVSGTLGDAAAGLKVLTGELMTQEAVFLCDRYHCPQARTELGWGLQQAGLSRCALDLSDGLLADAGHLARESGVGVVIEAGHIPLSEPFQAVVPVAKQLELAATGGDDYELLFTAAPAATEQIKALSRTLGLSLSAIGRVKEGQGVVLQDSQGQVHQFCRQGWVHG